ncbi:MAG: hypothetical protein ACR2JU_03170, partial [Nocardioidaceae bacterium]
MLKVVQGDSKSSDQAASLCAVARRARPRGCSADARRALQVEVAAYIDAHAKLLDLEGRWL